MANAAELYELTFRRGRDETSVLEPIIYWLITQALWFPNVNWNKGHSELLVQLFWKNTHPALHFTRPALLCRFCLRSHSKYLPSTVLPA